jgi:hypothetical protein
VRKEVFISFEAAADASEGEKWANSLLMYKREGAFGSMHLYASVHGLQHNYDLMLVAVYLKICFFCCY